MSQTLFALLLLASLPSFAQQGPVEIVERYLDDARGMIANAVDYVEAADKDRMRRMAEKAEVARINDAAGTSRCRGIGVMKAERNGRNIYVCPRFFSDPAMEGPNERLHAVVHEIAHLSGVGGGDGECEADRLASLVMGFNGIRLSRSGYDGRCRGRQQRN